MIENRDKQIRSMTVTKVISLRKELVLSSADAEKSFLSERQSSFIRLFHLSTINVEADV